MENCVMLIGITYCIVIDDFPVFLWFQGFFFFGVYNIESNATVAVLLNALLSVSVNCPIFFSPLHSGQGPHYVVKDILKPETILPQFPEFWDYT